MSNSLPVIKQIKTPIKIAKNLYLFDVIFIGLYMALMLQFENVVHPWLKYPYYVVNIIWGFCLTRKSDYNKGKHNWQTLLFYLTRDRAVYISEYRLKKEAKGEQI